MTTWHSLHIIISLRHLSHPLCLCPRIITLFYKLVSVCNLTFFVFILHALRILFTCLLRCKYNKMGEFYKIVVSREKCKWEINAWDNSIFEGRFIWPDDLLSIIIFILRWNNRSILILRNRNWSSLNTNNYF